MRFLLQFLIFLFSVSIACAQPTISTVLDDFSGGDELPITTNWTGGISDTVGSDCNRDNDRLENRGGAGDESCYYNVSTFGQKQEMFFTLPTGASWGTGSVSRAMACIKSVGTSGYDAYGLRLNPVAGANNDSVRIFRTTNGEAGFGNIGSDYASRDFANNDKYALVIDSSNFGTEVILKVFLDSGSGWTSIITHTETTTRIDCTASHQGFKLVTSTHNIDDYGGGNTIEASTSNFLMVLEAK